MYVCVHAYVCFVGICCIRTYVKGSYCTHVAIDTTMCILRPKQIDILSI